MEVRVCIAVPTAEGMVHVECMGSIAAMVGDLVAHGATCRVVSRSFLDVVVARNYLVAQFLESQYTHLLFVDNDMQFPADLCRRMLLLQKPAIGAVYARRVLHLDRLWEMAKRQAPKDEALAAAYEYTALGLGSIVAVRDGVVETKSTGTISVLADGTGQVDAVGTGFMLIARETFETMIAKGVARPTNRVPAHVPKPARGVFDFFGMLPTQAGDLLTDDFSFCVRWKACGGEIHAIVDADIGHYGEMRFGVPFLTKLKLGDA